MTIDFNRPFVFASTQIPSQGYLWADGYVFNLNSDAPIEGRTPLSVSIVSEMFELGLWVFIQYVETPEEEVDDEETDQVTDSVGDSAQVGGAIKSDGGSSTYYDIPVPEWLIARIVQRFLEGNAYVKTEELIEVAFKSDFDAGNVLKSLVRLFGAFNGAGKEGNSVDYEKKKIEYSVNKLAQRFERREAA